MTEGGPISRVEFSLSFVITETVSLAEKGNMEEENREEELDVVMERGNISRVEFDPSFEITDEVSPPGNDNYVTGSCVTGTATFLEPYTYGVVTLKTALSGWEIGMFTPAVGSTIAAALWPGIVNAVNHEATGKGVNFIVAVNHEAMGEGVNFIVAYGNLPPDRISRWGIQSRRYSTPFEEVKGK